MKPQSASLNRRRFFKNAVLASSSLYLGSSMQEQPLFAEGMVKDHELKRYQTRVVLLSIVYVFTSGIDRIAASTATTDAEITKLADSITQEILMKDIGLSPQEKSNVRDSVKAFVQGLLQAKSSKKASLTTFSDIMLTAPIVAGAWSGHQHPTISELTQALYGK